MEESKKGKRKVVRPQYFLASDVLKHDKPDDIWVSFLGKVYDITPLVQEFKGKREVKPLLAHAGKDISHWFDKRTQDIKYHVHPLTGVKVPYCPHGPIPHVPPQVPSVKWEPLPAVQPPYDGLPWWKDNRYFIGYLSENPRPIRIINSNCPETHRSNLAWVAGEEALQNVLERALLNAKFSNYVPKFEGKELLLDKTLDENNIADDRQKFNELGIVSNSYVPAIQLFYKDDFTT